MLIDNVKTTDDEARKARLSFQTFMHTLSGIPCVVSFNVFHQMLNLALRHRVLAMEERDVNVSTRGQLHRATLESMKSDYRAGGGMSAEMSWERLRAMSMVSAPWVMWVTMLRMEHLCVGGGTNPVWGHSPFANFADGKGISFPITIPLFTKLKVSMTSLGMAGGYKKMLDKEILQRKYEDFRSFVAQREGRPCLVLEEEFNKMFNAAFEYEVREKLMGSGKEQGFFVNTALRLMKETYAQGENTLYDFMGSRSDPQGLTWSVIRRLVEAHADVPWFVWCVMLRMEHLYEQDV